MYTSLDSYSLLSFVSLVSSHLSFIIFCHARLSCRAPNHTLCSKPPSPACDSADGYVDYDACRSSLKPEIRVKDGSLRVTGDTITMSSTGPVTLESANPTCAEGASVTADGLACMLEGHKAELADLSQMIEEQAATMQTEFGVKLPALKAELTEIVRQSEEATSEATDTKLANTISSVEQDMAKMKADLEKVVENDISDLKVKVGDLAKKLDAIPDLSDSEYTSEQSLFALDYTALGEGASGFAPLGEAGLDQYIRAQVKEGALNVKTGGAETPSLFTTHPFPGGTASQNDQFQMILHPHIVDSKIMEDGSRIGQVTFGFASKQADKKVGDGYVKQRKLLFSVAFWASKDGKAINICIEGNDNTCDVKRSFEIKNSDAARSVVLSYFPKSDTNPNTLVVVEAFLGLNGKGKSLGKASSDLMKDVNFIADDMFIRQGLEESEGKARGATVSTAKQLMTRAKRGSYTIRAHPRNGGIGGNENNVADEISRSNTGGWPNYGFQQACSGRTCTMDVKLDQVYEVTKMAICGYPGGSHRPSNSWVFEGLVEGSWKVLRQNRYEDFTTGNCFPNKQYKKELRLPQSGIVQSRNFRVRSTSGWTNQHMLIFNFGIWGCEGTCGAGGIATMNVAKIAISVTEQHVGLSEIINLLLAQQIATSQIAVQAGYLAVAQGSREELASGTCSTAENVMTADKRAKWGWTASATCGGIGGNPRNIADEINRQTTSGWPTYGFQQKCCGNCHIEIDFKSDHYIFCSFGIFGYPGGSHKPNGAWSVQGYASGEWKNLMKQSNNQKWAADNSGSWPIKDSKMMLVDPGMDEVPVTKLRILGNSFTNGHMLVFNFAGIGFKKV